jgi:hypothetical protein
LRDILSNIGINTITSLSLGFVKNGFPIPRVVEKLSDAKLAVNLELKRVCEEMILETAKAVVDPVSSFMIKVTAFKLRAERAAASSTSAPIGRLGMQGFASPQQCVAISLAFKEAIDTKLTTTVKKMSDYLGDKRTEAVLLVHIKVSYLDYWFHSNLFWV